MSQPISLRAMAWTEPGWYDDPDGGSSLRFWDGRSWAGCAEPMPGRLEIRLEDLAPERTERVRRLTAPRSPVASAEARDVAWVNGGEPDLVRRAAVLIGSALTTWSGLTGAPPRRTQTSLPSITPAARNRSTHTTVRPSQARSVSTIGGRGSHANGQWTWLVPALVLTGVALLAAGVGVGIAGNSAGSQTPTSATSMVPDNSPAHLLPPATVAPAVPPATGTPASPTTAPESAFAVGDRFSESCVLASPSTPARTPTSIQMQMSCPDVPPTFFIVQVTYGDPSFQVGPAGDAMLVTGQVAGVSETEGGDRILRVDADIIDR